MFKISHVIESLADFPKCQFPIHHCTGKESLSIPYPPKIMCSKHKGIFIFIFAFPLSTLNFKISLTSLYCTCFFGFMRTLLQTGVAYFSFYILKMKL